MPHTPLRQLRPKEFAIIGDEEFGFDSDDEDTENESEPEDEEQEQEQEQEEEEEQHVTIINNVSEEDPLLPQ